MKFSVLMSIYFKEKPDFFNKSMLSIWDKQTIKPSEIILVEDGALSTELNKIIKFWTVKLEGKLKIIHLKYNVGLGKALNVGLTHCTNELVARMDTDDISCATRFEKQLKIFETKSIDICGSWITEFDNNENDIVSYRRVPEMHDEITSYSKKRNPLNHPSVMYKKSEIEKIDSYQTLHGFEDYYLWNRAIQAGLKIYNIQEPLVNMRAGYGQLQRRGGLYYARNEIIFQNRLYKMGYINFFEYIRNLSMRVSIRLFPKYFLKKIYQSLRD